jgi:hypothetical protein
MQMDKSVKFCACMNGEMDLLKLNSVRNSFYGVYELVLGEYHLKIGSSPCCELEIGQDAR